MLAQNWKLPDEILQAIKQHHDSQKPFVIPSITAIVALADFMASKMGYHTVPGAKVAPLPPSLAQHVKNNMVDYKLIIRDLPLKMEKIRELYHIDD